jgi:hypothetical protein
MPRGSSSDAAKNPPGIMFDMIADGERLEWMSECISAWLSSRPVTATSGPAWAGPSWNWVASGTA